MYDEAHITELANDVLDIARNRLLVNLRYLDTALTFSGRAVYDGTISSDGKNLKYSPVFILKTYSGSKEQLTRTYLHTVLHCVFHHPFTGKSIRRDLWDLSCDIAAESVINELGLTCTNTDRSVRQEYITKQIKRKTGFLTAEKIYAFLKSSYSDFDIEDWSTLFAADEHSCWYHCETGPQDPGSKTYGESAMVLNDSSIISEWKSIAEHVQMEIEMYAKVRGRESSAMVQNLRSVNRERYDYSSFLKQFAVTHEDLKVSEDEFDYIYYTYGLSKYGKMPLIEPLEYRESSKIHDFVIAIDTSGSVAGEQVQAFLQKTYNILKENDSFASSVNIHIIQCDASVQSDTVITSTDDLDRYIADMHIRGLGGTDFRPVFTYVEKLCAEGKFSDLRGLLYFTDGLGSYPEFKPDYRTAFIFVDEGYSTPEVPAWAIKVVLRAEDIQE